MPNNTDFDEDTFFRDADREFGLENVSPGSLSEAEIFWRDHQPWLLERGYKLRPRYQPEWTPSWLDSKTSIWTAEDALEPKWGHLLDAVRLADQKPVLLKLTRSANDLEEAPITQYFSRADLRSDPRNHCVPLLELLQIPEVEDKIILVFPLLRAYNDPKFFTVGEVVEFFGQIIEGLQFIHEHHVAHRDATGVNILYDPTPLFPEGFHPVDTRRTPDRRRSVKPLRRRNHRCRYYLIDFGLAKRYDPTNGPPRDNVLMGADRTAPEFLEYIKDRNQTFNPFLTDIYYVGNVIRTDFLQPYLRLEFMVELVGEMVNGFEDSNAGNSERPDKVGDGGRPNVVSSLQRPDVAEVAKRFADIRSTLTPATLDTRLARRDESAMGRYIRDAWHWADLWLSDLTSTIFRRSIHLE